MTPPRTFAGHQVLAHHGPMPLSKFAECLGIEPRPASRVMHRLLETGVAERFTREGHSRYLYRAA